MLEEIQISPQNNNRAKALSLKQSPLKLTYDVEI